MFQEIVLLNTCFIFSKYLILSYINKGTKGTEILALFIWNVAQVVYIAAIARTGVLAFDLPATAGFFIFQVIYILLIMTNQVLLSS